MPEDSSTDPGAVEPAARRRTRGRPHATMRRDTVIFDHLRTAPNTKVGLSEALGISETDVYLSLRRLRNAGQIERMRGNTSHTWVVVSANGHVPESEVAATEVAETELPFPVIEFSAPDPDPEPVPEPLPVPEMVFYPEPQGPAQPETWF